jgi:protein SCO1/2
MRSWSLRLVLLLCALAASCERFTSWQTPTGGDFTLHSPAGPIDTRELRGKSLFIFFGFLHCPYVCPTTVRELNKMARSLTATEKKRVAFLFVTVDPARDSLALLKEHFSDKDPGFIPLTGSEDEIRRALKLFGGDFRVLPGEKPDEPFIDHTSTVFVVNRKGVWVNSLDYDASADEFRRALALAPTQAPFWSDEARSARLRVLGENADCDLGKGPCEYFTGAGERFEVELTPRPVPHLERVKLTVRARGHRLTPKLADLVGVDLSMGLIRPKLTPVNDRTWVGNFRLPTCELREMNWKLRLLLQDKSQENFEITYQFSSINSQPTTPSGPEATGVDK